MTTSAARWIREKPVLAFYLLTFTISWVSWMPQAAYSHGLFPVQIPLLFFVGGLGPGIAAFTVMRVLRGGEGDDELLGPLLRWRVGPVWYFVAIFGFIAIWLIAAGISDEVGQQLQSLDAWPVLVLTFLLYLMAAVPEEVGWRGFALPRLQVRYSALVSSLIVGVLWALWHVPLLLNADEVMSTYPLAPYFVYVVAESVLYGWLYNNVRGSLLIVVIFHAMSNTFGVFSPIAAAVTLVFAALVVAIFRPAHLSRTVERVVPPAHK